MSAFTNAGRRQSTLTSHSTLSKAGIYIRVATKPLNNALKVGGHPLAGTVHQMYGGTLAARTAQRFACAPGCAYAQKIPNARPVLQA